MSTNYYIVDIFKEAEYNKLMEEIKELESKYPNATIDVQYEQYKYHICKKSAGYRAMFQCVADIYDEHKSIENLEDLEEFYYSGMHNEIRDEYGNVYLWCEFADKVLPYNETDKSQYEEIKSIVIKDNLFIDDKGYTWSYIEFS